MNTIVEFFNRHKYFENSKLLQEKFPLDILYPFYFHGETKVN